MTKILVWDNIVGICIATTQLHGSGSVILFAWSLDQSGVIFVFFLPSFRNHIQQQQLWVSQPSFYWSGTAPTRLFEQVTAEALHRSQLIQNQYLLKWAMADDVM